MGKERLSSPIPYPNPLLFRLCLVSHGLAVSKYPFNFYRKFQITILYVLIFIIGIVGNLITCIVIRRHPLLQTHSRYFFIGYFLCITLCFSSYLLNLAMSDLVTLCVGLPFEVVMNWNQYPWPFPDFVCNLKGLVAETTSSVSILTILLFCIERYIAVNHPFVFVKLKPIRRQVSGRRVSYIH